MNVKKICSIVLMAMLVTSGLLLFQMNSSGDIVFKQVTGIVNDAPGPVRAWDATQNGEIYYYILNRTEEGSGTAPIKDNSGTSYYDPAINADITDWIPGDDCVLVVDREFGTYGVDHAGYVAFHSVNLDDAGVQFAPPVDLQKIPVPILTISGSDFINISWPAITDVSGILEGYTVYRSETNGTVSGDADWTIVGGSVGSPVTGLWFNNTVGVMGGTTYYYSLKIVTTGYANEDPGQVNNYENIEFGEGSGQIDTPLPPATVDYIVIYDEFGGMGPVDIGVGASIALEARGFNNTFGYVGLVDVDWDIAPAEGSLDTPTGYESNYTAGLNAGPITVTAIGVTNTSWTDDFTINILPPTVDYIEITADTLGVNPLTGGAVGVGFSEMGYAAGYNITSGFVQLVSADWTVEGGTASPLGSTPDTTHGIDVGTTDVTVWLNASWGGFTDSVVYNIQTPTVDYIDITIDAFGVTPLLGGSAPVGWQEWGFAAAYNDTIGFLYLVSADWTVEGGLASDLGITPDTTHGIDVGTTGGISVWLNASWGGFTDSVQFDIDLPTIDYIDITEDALGLITLGDKTPDVGFQEMGYAAGYNNTSGFVSLVAADWTVEGGSAAPVGSTPDTTHGINVGITDVVVYLNASFGGFTDSVMYTVQTPTVDYIDITADDLGVNPLAGGLVISPYVEWGNASAYNNTAGFLYLVSADWTVEGGDSSDLGSSPDVTHGINVGTIAAFVWLNATFGLFSDSVQYEISPWTIDYIAITDNTGLINITDKAPPVGFQEMGYAAAWNNTFGFLNLVSAVWEVTGGDASSIGTTPNTEHGIDVGLTGGVSVFLTATFGGLSDSVQYDVLPPTIDSIDITVDAGGLTTLGDKTVVVGFQEWGFCAGYNDTSGFVSLVSAAWSVSGGSSSLLGVTPATTNGIDVGTDGGITVTITADFGGFSDTVTYTILAPTIDYIDITMDAGGVNELLGGAVPVGWQEWGFAAGYNDTSGFVQLVSADWTVEGGGATPLGSTPDITHGIDVDITGGVSVWLNASWGGFTDSVQYDIIPPTIDYIDITVDILGVTELPGGSVPVGFSEMGYAAGYNDTSGFVSLVSADWTVAGGSATPVGSTPDTTHGINVGTDGGIDVTLTADFGLLTDTVTYSVQIPTVDYIEITVDNLGVTPVSDKDAGVSFQEWGYAAGYNDTSGFVQLVTADWTVSGGDATLLSVTPALQNGIDVGTIETTVTLEASYNSMTDTVTYNVLTPEIDDIIIRDASGGGGNPIWNDYPTYPSFRIYVVAETETFWAAGYNASLGYVGDVDVTWETWDTIFTAQDTYNGTVNPTSGSASTTFTANSDHGGALVVRAEYAPGIFNVTNILVIMSPQPNYIVIMDGPGGIGGAANIVSDRTYIGGDTDSFYAAGYNHTAGYIGDLEVDWVSTDTAVGDVDTATGIWTNFTAEPVTVDGTCSVSADYMGVVSNSTGTLTVLAPMVDSIKIVDAALDAGTDVGDVTYGVYETDLFWCAAFNGTTYLYDVLATWESSDESVGSVEAAVSPSEMFSAAKVDVDSTCVVTATYNNGVTDLTDDTGDLTVLAPTVDYIQIRIAPEGGGFIIGDMTVGVGYSNEFYASAYNDTIGYIGEIDVYWTISPISGVGTVDDEGVSTNFTALEVGTDSTCTVTATSKTDAISATTGTITVLTPTIDEIRIRDAASGLGDVLDTAITMEVTDTELVYAAGYNDTSGYVRDITTASWAVTNGIGSVGPPTGSSTTFTADAVGTGKITVSAAGVSNESADITVESGVDPKPDTPQPPILQKEGQDVTIIITPNIFDPYAVKHVVQRATGSDGPWENVTELVGLLDITYTDKGLDPDKKYYYRVIAVNDDGLPSDPSEAKSITTDPEDDFPWLLLILLLIIVIVIILLIVIMAKRKKPEEEMPPGAAAPEEVPMEEAPVEEEFAAEEGAFEEEYAPEETTYEEEPPYEEEPQYEEAPPEEPAPAEEPPVEEEEPSTPPPPPPPPPPPA